jgi:dsRNA-specific ribonuclease
MRERKVFIEFDFQAGKISIGEDWCNNGRPILEHNGMIYRHDIGKYLSIADQDEAESNISADQRTEFARLCEKEFTTDLSYGNIEEIVGDSLNSFVVELCKEICDEHEYAQSNNHALNGLLNIVDAHDILDRMLVLAYGLRINSTDSYIEKLTEKIEHDHKSEYQQDLQYTEQCLRDYRALLREQYEKKISWVVTDDSNVLKVCDDFNSAMEEAQKLAEEQASEEELETLEVWGDDMHTGWGVCPANDSGGYWPQVHAEYNGKRIDCLPWERGAK